VLTMKVVSKQVRLAATDLSNYLACHHLTELDLKVARGSLKPPDWRSPDLRIIQELGLQHEEAYLRFLEKSGLNVVILRDVTDETLALAQTQAHMQKGEDVIAQGALSKGRWFGRPDVLRKVCRASRLGAWSYEVYDCKLARETKATTILQLALYSELLTEIQGDEPEFMHVVPPGVSFKAEPYRLAEYAAYYRYVKARLEKDCDDGQAEETYPEPCFHCDACRWFRDCDTRRRSDDHLSLVAGIRTQQRGQLEAWDTRTMAKLGAMPIPLTEKPKRGSREGYERIREQARVQVEGRTIGKPVHELLPVVAGTGFCKLAAPVAGDLFVDLEGDPFAGDLEAGGGQEYLFGFASVGKGKELNYEKKWAFTAQEEKRGFEWLVDEIVRRWKEFPAMHVYHFGVYEPGAFKRLMGRYATREDQVDSMLRAGLLVDVHQVFKHAVRASVEEYSLKKLEVFYGFVRKTALVDSREAMRYVEHRLELGWYGTLPDRFREVMEGYNEEDCLSTAALRDWLERERQKLVVGGTEIPRPATGDGAPPEELDERQKRVAALVAALVDGVPVDALERSEEEEARWMTAQLLDWHRRENKASWWEGYRLAELDEEDLMDERAGLAGLRYVQRVGVERKIPVDRYAFEKQETEVRSEKDLYHRGEKIGSVQAIDLVKRTIDIKKTKKTAERHPTEVYVWDRPINVDAHADSLLRLGDWVKQNGINAAGAYRAARDLLLRRPPRLAGGETVAALPGEETKVTACRVSSALDSSVFAIQGPPGAGKTYTGARMICQLVKQGKKIGVTALSHKVIRNLLEEVVEAAQEVEIAGILCMQRSNEEEATAEIAVARDNEEAWAALRSATMNVVGGTSWLWTPAAVSEIVDVLFIDEAGQMALADVIAVAQAARNVVLIGDPQQLERPLKGSHPEGAEKSALQHLIGEHKTIPPTIGMLLPETWRMHPKICEYTSKMFYEDRLRARPVTEARVFQGHRWLDGPGLWFVPVSHEGNRNSSAEEVEVVARIAESLVGQGVEWFRSTGNCRPVTWDDVLIVAPYNAQVADLSVRLPNARVGTVDKFQGQEAAVVIYSLTTSSLEDAPRGMEFLYSLNRLNVATSRAMSNVILVASPKLLEPECRSPRQMQLANALCWYLELAVTNTE
jgi:predicted RecB family nuclease